MVSAALFGSTARGESGPGSDIDLVFVVRDDAGGDHWDEQLHSLGAQVLAWTGNRLEYLVFTEEHLRTIVAADEPLVGSLRSEAITLVGTQLRSILSVGDAR